MSRAKDRQAAQCGPAPSRSGTASVAGLPGIRSIVRGGKGPGVPESLNPFAFHGLGDVDVAF